MREPDKKAVNQMASKEVDRVEKILVVWMDVEKILVVWMEGHWRPT